MEIQIKKHNNLKGHVTVSPDKSISHRSIMFGAIANGVTEVDNFLNGEDCLSTISCFRKLGINIVNNSNKILIHGKGLHGLSRPTNILDVGNSGTTARLMSGILAGQAFTCNLTGDASIQTRPMKRICTPLSEMGADFEFAHNIHKLPFSIKGGELKAINYNLEVASAQVKSAILLAGLYANSNTTVCEPAQSRNHTELMLSSFGANIICTDKSVTISPNPVLSGQKISVPGDISSAAYFIAAGLITTGSEILIKNVCLNPTRDGIIRVAHAMGGNIKIENITTISGELVGDLIVSSSELNGTVIEGSIIPTLIDELPIIAVMGAFAKGTTVIRDASELRVKESNRIDTMVNYLRETGCDIEATEDGMIIRGGNTLHGIEIDPLMDHRIAMSFAIMGLQTEGVMTIKNAQYASVSYPDFYKDINSIINN